MVLHHVRRMYFMANIHSIILWKMADYQTFINDIDNIKKRYLKEKNECLGIY